MRYCVYVFEIYSFLCCSHSNLLYSLCTYLCILLYGNSFSIFGVEIQHHDIFVSRQDFYLHYDFDFYSNTTWKIKHKITHDCTNFHWFKFSCYKTSVNLHNTMDEIYLTDLRYYKAAESECRENVSHSAKIGHKLSFIISKWNWSTNLDLLRLGEGDLECDALRERLWLRDLLRRRFDTWFPYSLPVLLSEPLSSSDFIFFKFGKVNGEVPNFTGVSETT